MRVEELSPLPEGSCLVHIGPYKTGSTSIQEALMSVRDRLGEHGAAYPGRGSRIMRPGWAVIGETPRGRTPARTEEWTDLCEEVARLADRRVCVSTEDFGRVGHRIAPRVVEGMGGDRVHVLTVARRLDRLIPSQWQQRAQEFQTETYDEYLHAVLDRDAPRDSTARRSFWASHDLGRTLDVWSKALGDASRLVVVVADEQDRTLLPSAFERLLALPAGMLQGERPSNPSLSYNGCEVTRRLNVVAAERGWPDDVFSRMTQQAGREMKRAGKVPGDVAVPGIPPWARDRLEELSLARKEALLRSGARIVGDPDLLTDVSAVTDLPASVDSISLEAAGYAVTGAARGYVRATRNLLRQRSRDLLVARASATDPREAALAATPARELARLAARGLRGSGRGGRRE